MPEFGVLGALRVVTDAGRVTLPGKERTLLAVLLLRAPQVVPMDTIIDVLWDTAPPPGARNTAQGHVKRLRRQLGDAAGRIVTHGAGYLADIKPGELDLAQFTGLHNRARSEANSGNWEMVSSLLADGLKMWRGDPLADVPSPTLLRTDAPRLAELRAQALDLRIEADLRRGLHDEVIAELMQLVAGQPFRERSQAQLMLALYRSGRQGDALAAYQRARAVLRAELGIEPGRELAELHRRILAADPALIQPAGRRPAIGFAGAAPQPMAPAPPRPMQTPADVPDFTGREETISQIHAVLGTDGSAADRTPEGASGPPVISVVAISGPGGVGKSALAIHVAHQLADQFPGGQLYASLGGASDPLRPADVLASFLADVGVPHSAIPVAEAERSARYRTMLADRKILVTLDDARDASQVRPLLPGTGGSAVIVTSRRTLADLAGARLFDLDVLAPSEARDLFVAIAGPTVVASWPAETGIVLASCAGLPLAIRIAASRLAARPGWTVGHLSRLLADERQRLAELKAGDLAVRASFAVSYRALSPAPARVFRLLGLAGLRQISLAAAAALAGQPPDDVASALETLVDAHLLQAPTPDRFVMHDLLRIYAAELAEQADSVKERATAVNRMLDWYAATAIVVADVVGPNRRFGTTGAAAADGTERTPARALAWFERERRNLISVTGRAAKLGRHDIAARIPAAMWVFFHRKPFREDWLATHQIGVASARRLGDDAILSSLLNGLGQVNGRLGRFADARPHLIEAHAIRRRLGNRRGEAAVLNSLGVLHGDHGSPEEGLDYLRQAHAIHADIGDTAGAAIALNNIGDVLIRLKRHEEALQNLREALACSRAAHDRYVESITLNNIGQAYLAMGRPEEAVRHFKLALAAFDQDGEDVRHLGDLFYYLGRSLDSLGQTRDARQTWQSALPILDQLGDPRAAELRIRLNGKS